MIRLLERDLDSFFAAPFAAYGPGSPYVSPMKGDLERFLSLKNPLFASADDFTVFTAVRDGRPVGRITAHLHRASNTRFAEARGCFGYFDCADDPQAAQTLLDAAQDWARARGQTRLVGNFNLTAMQQAGVMTSGFDHAPYTDHIWGPPWLPGLLEQAGFARDFPMTTVEKRLDQSDPLRPISDADRAALLADGFTFAPVTRRTIAARLEDARAILNASFTDNPMFVPVSQDEFSFQARDMKWVMDPRLSVVMHHKGRPAGAIIAIPDLNPLLRATGSRLRASTPWHYLRFRANRTRALVIFQGVMPEFQGRSLNPLMLTRVLSAMRVAGYTTLGGTWIADSNRASLRQAEKIGALPLHGLHLYSKDLS